MVKHFAHYAAAIEELEAFGFTQDRDGKWFTPACVAMIHPINGTEKVRVSYWPDNAGTEERVTRNLHDM